MDIREVAKQYPGITIRGNSIQIEFAINRRRFRESIPVKPTKTILNELARKREAILYEIAIGTFDYAKHFPTSKKAIAFSKEPGSAITIEKALKDWYKLNYKRWQPSTRKGYETCIWSSLIPQFGKLKLTELTPRMVNQWIGTLKVSNKRINNILGPLRSMYRDAYCDELIDKNPMERVKNLSITQREPNPFKPDEIERILNHLQGQERNLIQFGFWSGLRTSELIALRWQDVDFDNNRIYVRIAKVLKKEKTTKTANGQRTVELQVQARDALERQMEFSQHRETVFLDPQTASSWTSDQPIRRKVWIPTLNVLGIAYRNPYQMRHTFASTMLSRGENPMWVANQLGHKDWGMIRQIYGRWIGQN